MKKILLGVLLISTLSLGAVTKDLVRYETGWDGASRDTLVMKLKRKISSGWRIVSMVKLNDRYLLVYFEKPDYKIEDVK